MDEVLRTGRAVILNQQQRLATESQEEREARLQQVILSQQQRLASETPSEAQIRHEQDRENHRRRRNMDLALPLFQQPAVRSKMTNFHSKIAALEMSKCITCLEKFPALNVKAVSPHNEDTECGRCRQDKHIPKVYSSSNNMDPGPVPSELLVC